MTVAANALSGHFIGGAWTEARPDAVSVNPADPSDTVLRHSRATEAELDDAFAAAKAGAKGWSQLPATLRASFLRRIAGLIQRDEAALTDLVIREEGKSHPEANGEVRRAAAIFHFHAAQAWQAQGEVFASTNPAEEIRTVRTPVGVVAVITPWNFPIAIPAWKIAPALVHGNPIVWKPASPTPAVAVALMRLIEEAELPPGVLNLVLGTGSVGAAMTRHPDVAAISFTGSDTVCKAIWNEATARGVRVQLEMGGQSAAIVSDDANLGQAARQIVIGAMGASGQKCTATRRMIALSSIYDEIVERVIAEIAMLSVGDGRDPRNQVGPLITSSAREEVLDSVRRAQVEGGTLLVGGKLDQPSLQEGYYVAPTVVADVAGGSHLAQDEVFGPVLGVIRVADVDEAFARANETRFGLAAAVFTTSEITTRRALAELDVGIIHINNATTGGEPHVPFGGMRDSSSQAPREQGQTARDFFTKLKTAYIEAVA